MHIMNRPCPKCGGQLHLDYAEGWEGNCLQCGFTLPLENEEVPAHLKPRSYSTVSRESPLAVHVARNFQDSISLPFFKFQNKRHT